ncbi:MAG: transaldolase family protein [Snowella sp.]|nr:transaldolase family protein [Snowella sp.]
MIYLDSALIEDAKVAQNWGWVKGITTNPSLLAKSPLSPEETLQQLAQLSPGELYYQLMSTDYAGMVKEARKAYALIGEKTVLKIPATPIGFQVVAYLSDKIPCSVTAIYSPAQAAIAKEAGAKYAIAYVNRATRLLGDGLKLVRDMAQVLAGSSTEILAASLKTPEEAANALIAGANHLTIPLEILNSMTTQELSEQTVAEFNQQGRGI